MKTRIAVAISALFIASLGATAYAQQTPPSPPSTTTPPPAQTQPQPPMTPPSASSMGNDQPGQSAGMSNEHGSNGSVSNDMVEQKVKRALTAHGVTATHVTVAFQDGTVTLSGTVANKRDISKAKKAAMRVHGVKHVDASALQAKGSNAS